MAVAWLSIAISLCLCPLLHGWQAPVADTATYRPPATANNAKDPWFKRDAQLLSGRILDFDSVYITLLLESGDQQQMPSRFVEQVEFKWATDEAEKAAALVQERKYRDAVRAIAACYKELPKWQQRILIAKMVTCFSALGLKRQAGVFFLNLAVEKPPTMLYADMPLSWTPVAPPQDLHTASLEWIESDDPHAQLLGASWLLSGAERTKAEKIIQQLRNHKNPTIAELATFQALRILPPPRIQATYTQRMSRTAQLNAPLQLGPLATLADQMRRLGELDVAVGIWARIATHCGSRYHLAANALDECSKQLALSGRVAEQAAVNKWSARYQAE